VQSQVGTYVKQLAGESLVYGVAGVITRCIGIVLIPLYTRVFKPDDYGIVALLDVFIMLVLQFVVLGLDTATTRWFFDSDDPADHRSAISSWFWCQFTVGMIVAAVIALLSPWISNLLLGSEQYSPLLRLAAFAMPLFAGGYVARSWLRFQRRPLLTVTFSSCATLATVGLVILYVLVWRRGLSGLYTARLIGEVLTCLTGVVILGKWMSPRAVSWTRLKSMLRYGLPAVPAGIGLWLMMSSNRFILDRFSTKAEVGLFFAAAQIASAVGLVCGAFQTAWFPFALSIHKEETARRVYAKVLDLYSFFGCALCTALTLFAPLVFRLLTYKPYYAAASCVSFLAFTMFLEPARQIAWLGSSIVKDSKPLALSLGLGAAGSIGLGFVLIPPFGRDGAAAANMLAYCLSVVYLFRMSQKSYYIPYRWRVTLTCFVFSWLLIALDRWLIPDDSLSTYLIRGAMLLLFLPLGVWFGLIRWRYLRELLARGPSESQQEIA